MATRVTSTAFVGRAPELAELEAAWQDAAAGRPSLAFVAGESGVGKSRLLAELDRRLTRAGARVLAGDCVELGAGELPYAPIVAALRPLHRDGADPALGRLPPTLRAELAAVLPGLGATPAPVRGPEPPGAAQGRLFEALLALVGELAAAQPLVLLVEDLHWADSSTRAFLAFLARSLCAQRVLLVASYRADELHRRHPLRPLLAELEREPRARRIELQPLTREELAAQLEGILGAAPRPDLVARLWNRSEGNPLFTEELLAAGLDGRGGLPPTLRDALIVRTERLPAAAQELLRVLAVGRRLDHELLAGAGGLDARELRDALREAVAAHLLEASDDGTYAFRHALLREAVEEDLLPGERAHLHLALAHAMERRAAATAGGAGAHLAAGIAHHYQEAGDRPAALAAAVRAAEAADRVHAHGEAAGLLERALELWELVADPQAVAGHDRAELLVRAARARALRNEPARAEGLLRAALELVDPAADPERAAAMMERLAHAEWHRGRQEAALETTARALELLADGGATPAKAALMSWQAKAYMLMGRYRRAVEWAGDALAVAQAAGDRVAEGRALNAYGIAAMTLGDVDAGEGALRRAMGIARELGLAEELSTAYINLGDALHQAGRSPEAVDVLREGIAVTERATGRTTWTRLELAEILLDTGAWDEVDELLPPPERRLQGTTLLFAELTRASLALHRGRDEEAVAPLERAAVDAGDNLEPQFTGPLGALTAERHRRAGDLTAAAAAVDLALDRILCCSDDSPRVARVAAVGVDIQADLAQRARDRGDVEGAAAAAGRAETLAAFVAAAAQDAPGRPLEAAYLAGARADLARAKGADDPAAWRTAQAAWTALGRPHLAAAAALREAEALVAAGARDLAHAPLAGALRTAEALGAGRLLREARSLAARARLRLEVPGGSGPGLVAEEADGGSQAGSGGSPGPTDPFDLTPRERQVLALLAEGATNREIGQQLFMAEKTASVHVSRILTKLGVRSRGQAAAIAHRLGLEHTPV